MPNVRNIRRIAPQVDTGCFMEMSPPTSQFQLRSDPSSGRTTQLPTPPSGRLLIRPLSQGGPKIDSTTGVSFEVVDRAYYLDVARRGSDRTAGARRNQ